jgi:tetratricopeptide (TPR) repeat protein
VASDQGEYEKARPLYEEGLKLQTELDNKIGIAAATYNLGICELYQKNDGRAQTLFEECLRLFRDLQHRSGVGSVLDNLGILALRRGDVEAASALFEECLRLWIEIGDKKGAVQGLEEMAAVCAARSDSRRAARLWGAAKALRESIGIAESSGEMEDQAVQLDRLRSAMGDGPFTAAMQEGRSLSLEDAVAEALGAE